MPNLRQHIDVCVQAGRPHEMCVVLNFWMGLETIKKHGMKGDIKEVDLTLLTDEELGILEKTFRKHENGTRFLAWKIIEEEKQRRG